MGQRSITMNPPKPELVSDLFLAQSKSRILNVYFMKTANILVYGYITVYGYVLNYYDT